MLVPAAARHLIPLPDGLDPVAAAPLTDAGLTPYHAVRRSWSKLVPGSTAVVIGVGGLGHLGVQILRATTATRVIAVDSRSEALDLARNCGAEITLAPGADAAREIRAHCKGRGADVVLDFVGADDTLALAAAVARSGGDLSIVGIAGGTLPVSVFSLAWEVAVQSIYWGSRPELVEVLALAAAGLVRPQITTFDLDGAIDAYPAMQTGKLEGRAVIVPSP
jgi:propanol-preferring alcohol dehydrogenase